MIKPSEHHTKQSFIQPLFRGGNQSSEILSDMPKVKLIVNGTSAKQNQVYTSLPQRLRALQVTTHLSWTGESSRSPQV